MPWFRRLRQIERKLDWLVHEVSAMRRSNTEEREDMSQMADEILAKLEEANTKQDGFLVILNALKANQDNPAKLQQIAKSIGEQQADWEAGFATNTAPEMPPEEQPVA